MESPPGSTVPLSVTVVVARSLAEPVELVGLACASVVVVVGASPALVEFADWPPEPPELELPESELPESEAEPVEDWLEVPAGHPSSSSLESSASA